jgi:hypothetical protein
MRDSRYDGAAPTTDAVSVNPTRSCTLKKPVLKKLIAAGGMHLGFQTIAEFFKHKIHAPVGTG